MPNVLKSDNGGDFKKRLSSFFLRQMMISRPYKPKARDMVDTSAQYILRYAKAYKKKSTGSRIYEVF